VLTESPTPLAPRFMTKSRKCLVGERLDGCPLSGLVIAQATRDHNGGDQRHGAASTGR
jgi:hypothetical protein